MILVHVEVEKNINTAAVDKRRKYGFYIKRTIKSFEERRE